MTTNKQKSIFHYDLICKTCPVGNNCPDYNVDSDCVYYHHYDDNKTWIANNIESLKSMITMNSEYLERTIKLESMTGGNDKNVSMLIERNKKLLATLDIAMEIERLEAKHNNKNPKSTGVLQQIFGTNIYEQPSSQSIDEDEPESEDENTLQ